MPRHGHAGLLGPRAEHDRRHGRRTDAASHPHAAAHGLDFVSSATCRARTSPSRRSWPTATANWKEIKTAYTAGDAMKMNIFFRDGSGVKCYAYVTRIKTATADPSANEFSKDITFSPFGVELMDAP